MSDKRREAFEKYEVLKERRDEVRFQIDVLRVEEDELDKEIKALYTDMRLHKPEETNG